MPIYEFQCPDGRIIEDLVPVGTDQIRDPQTGETARRILSPTRTNFKFNDQKLKP